MEDLNSKKGIMTHEISPIRTENQALQFRAAVMDVTVENKTELLENSDGKLRALTTGLYDQTGELVTSKKTARRAEKVLANFDTRISNDIGSGALLNMASVSEARLGDPSAGGW